MSCTAEVHVQFRDREALTAACGELKLSLTHGSVTFYDGAEHVGDLVQLPGWPHPLGIKGTDRVSMDTYEGRWGDMAEHNVLIDAGLKERLTLGAADETEEIRQIRALARARVHEGGECEIDDEATVSKDSGEDSPHGADVPAWLWVDFGAAPRMGVYCANRQAKGSVVSAAAIRACGEKDATPTVDGMGESREQVTNALEPGSTASSTKNREA